MVEAGKIDWALHDNEAGPSMWEMINLDETLGYLWDFARQSGDTLVYVNADHETGVPVFHYRHLDEDTVNHKSSQGENAVRRKYGLCQLSVLPKSICP